MMCMLLPCHRVLEDTGGETTINSRPYNRFLQCRWEGSMSDFFFYGRNIPVKSPIGRMCSHCPIENSPLSLNVFVKRKKARP